MVTGRVTDASLVVGPAVAHFGWATTSYDELAGAVVAGHVLECGTQATGGNFSGFLSMVSQPRTTGSGSTAGIPARRAGLRRVVGRHQARRHRRRGEHRHGDGAADVRGAVHALPRPRRHRPPRHGRARRRRARPGADLRGPRVRAARAAQGLRQRARRLPQLRRVRAHRPRRRRQGRLGACPARAAAARVVGHVDLGAPAAEDADTEEGASTPAALRRPGRLAGSGGTRLQPRRRRAGARVVPRLHDDRPARRRHAVRRLPRGVRRPLGRAPSPDGDRRTHADRPDRSAARHPSPD